ncbi:unnamed protein product [Calicophoron daubneyi]|uniref:Protein SERAC1 n=1 Tax=Calicophoron daubneyi TaxID=300641 RepID=A0AAV2TQL1_CALDB
MWLLFSSFSSFSVFVRIRRMPGYLSAAGKATSALCVIWSAYMLARIRSRRTQRAHVNERSSNTDRDRPDSVEWTEAIDLLSPSTDSSPVESFTYPPITGETNTDTSESLIRHGWHVLSGWIRRGIENANHAFLANESTCNNPIGIDELTAFFYLIAELAERTGAYPPHSEILPRRSKFHLPGRNQSPKTLLESFLTSLVSYTKNDKFVELLLLNDQFPHMLRRIAQVALDLIPGATTRLSNSSTTLSNETFGPSYSSAEERFTVNFSNETCSNEQMIEVTDDYPEYTVHVLLANILANISRQRSARPLLHIREIVTLSRLWTKSPSLHLVLFNEKMLHNLEVHENALRTSEREDNLAERLTPIYHPNIFRLDTANTEDYDCDIIFVHGMNGSVFHTWRQNESESPDGATITKCWPRDWLPKDITKSRILGIDTVLSPFIWNPICPADCIRRSMDLRAKAILLQLQEAGVGQRPVIWVTHSAGGILVKEMLRFSSVLSPPVAPHETQDSTEQSLKDFVPRAASAQATLCDMDSGDLSRACVSDEEYAHPSSKSSKVRWYSDQQEPESVEPLNFRWSNLNVGGLEELAFPPFCSFEDFKNPGVDVDSPTNSTSVADMTKGVVFMSVPHRGNRSLFALYFPPLRWTLTPEAIQFERNCQYMLNLHSWFTLWALKSHLDILTVVETRRTPVNRLWSVLLVPEDKRDAELGEIVHIDSDHIKISKPQSQTDKVYQSLLQFIRKVRSEGGSSESDMDVDSLDEG